MGWQALLAVGLEAGGEAEHGGQVGAGDVSVDEADFGALFGEGDGEVGGDGGLANAALVGGDGDDVADAVESVGAPGIGERGWGGWHPRAGGVGRYRALILLVRPRARAESGGCGGRASPVALTGGKRQFSAGACRGGYEQPGAIAVGDAGGVRRCVGLPLRFRQRRDRVVTLVRVLGVHEGRRKAGQARQVVGPAQGTGHRWRASGY